jgi:hypothetical protein
MTMNQDDFVVRYQDQGRGMAVATLDGYRSYPVRSMYAAARHRQGYGVVDPQASQLAAARLIAEVLRTYTVGALKVGFSLDEIARWGRWGILAPLVSKSDFQRVVEANLQRTGQDIAKWSTIYLQWALNGQRDGSLGSMPGSPYTWGQWIAFARDLNSDIAYQTKVVWDNSEVLAALNALAKTGADLTKPIDGWPTWVWALLAVGGLQVAGIYVPLITPVIKSLFREARATRTKSQKKSSYVQRRLSR